MYTLWALVRRHIKIFFKDKVMFLTSLVTPLILLLLYAAFLARVFKNSFIAAMPQGAPLKLVNAAVGGQLLSSLLAVCCVTVAFCSNMLMVTDKTTGAASDFAVSPVRRSVLALSYYIATVTTTLIICGVAMAAGLVYVAASGWYMRATDVLLLALDMLLLVLFGAALSSVINFFLSTQGQMQAVGTVVSAGYGFICGAYMPISQLGKGMGHALSFLPGTYGTSLMRNHALTGVLKEMQGLGWPQDVVKSIADSVDARLCFFGHAVPVGVMYAVLAASTALLIGVYALLCYGKARRAAR